LKLETQSAHDVVARLDEARKQAGSGDLLLAFDADGTLWSGDIGLDAFDALLASRRVHDRALGALEAEAASIGLSERGDAVRVARALYDAYEAGRYAEDRVFAMMAWIFAGWTAEDVAAFADQLLRHVALHERVRPEIHVVLDWARAWDVDVYVVSASPRIVVERGVRPLGVAEDRVLAMTPAARDGTLEPWLEGPVVYAEGKLVALRNARPDAVILGGFGDSGYDAAFLREARVAVAVRPTASLLSRARSIDGLVEMRG